MDFSNKQANVFLQEDFDEVMEWLTCSGAGDIGVPKGDVVLKYCPDPRSVNDYRASSSIANEAAAQTMQLLRPLRTVRNHLLEIEDPFNCRVNWATAGERTNPASYNVAAWFYYSRFTDGAITPVASVEGTDGDRTGTSGTINGSGFSFVYRLAGYVADLTTDAALYAVAAAQASPATELRDKVKLGQIAYAVGDAQAIVKTENEWLTWADAAAKPFLASDVFTDVVIISTMDADRVIVCRDGSSTLVGGLAYSDDGGDSWTEVEVGSVSTEGINCIDYDASGRLWVGGDSGRIYRSVDQGVNWTLQCDGTGNAENINDISCHPTNANIILAVAADNELTYSVNGATFTNMAGPEASRALLCCGVNVYGHWHIGTDDGNLYQSTNRGSDWESILDLETGAWQDIAFDAKFDHFAFAVYEVSDVGTLYRSEDGGASWIVTTIPAGTPTNSGLNGCCLCGPNLGYVVGDEHGSVNMILRFEPASA